jgi:hypothetical protein
VLKNDAQERSIGSSVSGKRGVVAIDGVAMMMRGSVREEINSHKNKFDRSPY